MSSNQHSGKKGKSKELQGADRLPPPILNTGCFTNGPIHHRGSRGNTPTLRSQVCRTASPRTAKHFHREGKKQDLASTPTRRQVDSSNSASVSPLQKHDLNHSPWQLGGRTSGNLCSKYNKYSPRGKYTLAKDVELCSSPKRHSSSLLMRRRRSSQEGEIRFHCSSLAENLADSGSVDIHAQEDVNEEGLHRSVQRPLERMIMQMREEPSSPRTPR